MPHDTLALDISALELKYGGVRALHGVSLVVPGGHVVGLIGPNGSGKSSLINVVSGVYRGSYGGQVSIGGVDTRTLKAVARTRSGLARNFQGIRLFDTLTVHQNIMMGGHVRFESGCLASILRTPTYRREHAVVRERALEVMSMFGDRLLPRGHQQVLSLSYANRRRVELARALMSDPKLLLLDEPMAGMNPHETEELTQQLHDLRVRTSMSMLLVEHKMGVISELCEDVYVLDSGDVIAHGTPTQVQNDPKVMEAFLG